MGKDIGDWHKFTSLIVSQVSSRQYMQLCVQCSLMTVPFPSLYASPRLFHSKKKRRWTRYVHLDGNRTDGDEEELGDLIESIESTVTIQSASPHFPCFPSFSLFAHHIARQESVDLFLFMHFIFFSFQIEKCRNPLGIFFSYLKIAPLVLRGRNLWNLWCRRFVRPETGGAGKWGSV